MKPIIGITGNFRFDEHQCTLAEGYYKSLYEAGAIPVIIPPTQKNDWVTLLDSFDGILFSGGGDIDSDLLGEEYDPSVSGVDRVRDEMEIELVRLAYNRQIPMLGICKGAQVINFALGGKLYQDIKSFAKINHSQDTPKKEYSHKVILTEENSVLKRLFAKEHIDVNSFHHQAIKTAAPCLKVTAMSEDGIVEAVESNEFKSILGVQWHPEGLDDGEHKRLFDWFVGEAESFKSAKEVHRTVLSLDSHCDTPMIFDDIEEARGQEFKSSKVQEFKGSLWDISIRNPLTLVDFEKMTEGHLDATIMVAYLKQGARDEASLLAATEKADRILNEISQMASGHIALCSKDLVEMKRMGRKAVMMGIENGYAIGRDISNVEKFRKKGVVYMTLCHNGDNDICDSAKGNGEHGGVSSFGAEVIKEMNRVGMVVDLSHASEKSFYDALDISEVPIVCSHSSAKALCNHPRNLTDDQMRALRRKDGVAQVTFYSGFLREGGNATIEDAVRHLNHMVDVMGVEHVGIGSDFDGDGGVPGIASASELINFTRRLLKERYSEKDFELIWGGNFLRVLGKSYKN